MSTAATLSNPRINVNLTPNSYDELKRLAEEAGVDMSQFVRNSIRVYGLLRRAVGKDDKQVYIGKDSKIEKEVLIP